MAPAARTDGVQIRLRGMLEAAMDVALSFVLKQRLNRLDNQGELQKGLWPCFRSLHEFVPGAAAQGGRVARLCLIVGRSCGGGLLCAVV